MASSSSLSSFWLRAAFVPASLPAVVYLRDCCLGVTKIRGASMEPTLQDGDYVLVRKCEAGIWLQGLLSMAASRSTWFSTFLASRYYINPSDDEDRAAWIRFQKLQSSSSTLTPTPGYFFSGRPPLVLPGHVLVYQNPFALRKEYHIKRVVAVGGQWVRFTYQQADEKGVESRDDNSSNNEDYEDDYEKQEFFRSRYPHTHHRHDNQNSQNSFSSSSHEHQRIEALPAHVLHVEGDRAENSLDSRTTGPVSSNLVVGVAEYILWPPSRWQRIRRRPVGMDAPDGGPRAIWY